MQVTPEGQVTIPETIRRRLGIRANTNVEFVERDGEIVLKIEQTAPKETISEWLERVRGSWQSPMTSDDVMHLTRGED